MSNLFMALQTSVRKKMIVGLVLIYGSYQVANAQAKKKADADTYNFSQLWFVDERKNMVSMPPAIIRIRIRLTDIQYSDKQ